ncbi:MAG: DUF3037 domain-containing protein [Siculibacillus sp.]|nr:DUF3037 domain-containing protein [Siculibacillus sp.]
MTEKRSYSYTVLRYVHDVTTSEFVNVGIVLHVPSEGNLRVRTRHTIGRIKDVFPDLDRQAFVDAMASVERGIKTVAKDIATSGMLPCDGDAATYARRALPSDYSSLQWSPIGTGLTDNADKTFERLFERFVTRYDEHTARRRTDDEVWRPVRDLLQERNIAVPLEKKEIIGKTDVISFDRTWKNGVWHAYEPVSLDLADADGIKDKARRWLGHLAAVADGPSDDFKVYFILGKPRKQALMPAYESAKAILACAPGGPSIYEEDEVESLVSSIEDEYREHVEGVRS